MDADDEALLALGRVPNLSAPQLLTALQALSMQASTAASVASLIGRAPQQLRLLGFGPAAVAALACPDREQLARDQCWVRSEGISLVDATSSLYPPQLLRIANPPALLYVRGSPQALCAPQLAIVGSRRASNLGRRTAFEFARRLACAGLAITSGLAEGIDAAGHEGALAVRGAGIAVLGHGLDQCYPRSNADLAERLLETGAVISEWPPATPPLRGHFPRRNRLIAGLSLGTLVVEASRRSGSLSTARHARLAHRPVFAVPGSIYSPLFEGCHELIRSGANLASTPSDILHDLAFSVDKHNVTNKTIAPSRPVAPFAPLDKRQKILLDALGFTPTSVDDLVISTGLPVNVISGTLLILEYGGLVLRETDGRYVRMRIPRRW